MVQSKVSGFQIADTDGQQEKGHAVKTEQFKTEEQTADWTVGHTAEYGNHTTGSGQRWRKSGQLTEDTSESCTDKQSWDNLSAFKSASQCDGSKNYFQQKSGRNHFTGDGICNDIHTGTKIIGSVKKFCQQDNQKSTRDYTDPFVWYMLLIKMFRAMQDGTEQDADSSAE